MPKFVTKSHCKTGGLSINSKYITKPKPGSKTIMWFSRAAMGAPNVAKEQGTVPPAHDNAQARALTLLGSTASILLRPAMPAER